MDATENPTVQQSVPGKKPLIGITSSFSAKEEVGRITKLGAPFQQWQMLADDYVSAIEAAGGTPIILPLVKAAESLFPVLDILDGILFTGGNDVNPYLYGQVPQPGLGEISIQRDTVESAVMRQALAHYTMPIWGICRGHQLLNVVHGGTLHQDLKGNGVTEQEHVLSNFPMCYGSQRGHLQEDSRMYAILKSKEIRYNSFHHQAVDQVGEGLRPIVIGEDGVIEAVEGTGERFIMGTQWHPEMMHGANTNYDAVFKAFVRLCAGNAWDPEV